jgi:hypothetical protein
MASSDGSVEIRITGSVDPSVAASATAAKSSLATIGDSAATASAATATVAATAELTARATAAQAAAFTTATEAVRGNTVAMRETLVVGRELLRGNLTRLPGSLSILAQQFAISGKSAGSFASTIAKSFGLIKVAQDADLAGLAASAAATAQVIEQRVASAGSAIVAADAEVLLAEAELDASVGSDAEAAAQARVAKAHEGVALASREAAIAESALAEANLGVATTAADAAAAESVMLGPVAIFAAAAAAVGAVTLATIQYDEEQKKLTATTLGVGAASGLTAEQLQHIGDSANLASQSISETTQAAQAFAAAGVRSEDVANGLSNSIQTYANLTGEKAPEAQKKLAEAFKDPVKGAKDLHDQLGILDGDQIEEINRLSELGDKQGAINVLYQAYKQRIDEANNAGVGATSTWGEMKNAVSDLWKWLGNANGALLNHIGLLGDMRTAAAAAATQEERLVQDRAHLNDLSAKGASLYDTTPEGEAAKRRNDLTGSLNQLKQALQADTLLHGANSDAVRRDRQAIEDYTHAVTTYMTPVQKKIAADKLDVEIAEARHKHNKQLVADLTEQKALLEEAGKVESDADARALAAGKGDVAGARTGSGRTKKAADDQVAIWEEALHQQEIDSNNFFADETESELKFWQSKLDLVKKGSKDWRDIQSKIYDAEKTLRHKAYDEKLADLNDGLEADRNNFKKFQSDWEAKLAFIKSTFKEESTEYKDAHRQMESEMRQHEDAMIQAELSGQSKSIAALKAHLSAMNQLRQTDAKIQEDLVKEQSDGTILGEVQAAARLGDIHHQLAQDEIADATAVFNAEDTLRQQGLAKAFAAWGKDDERYKNALKDELDATKAFYDQIALLQAKSSEQQIADIIAVENAYSGYVSGTVSATVSGLDGIVSKTKTWQQALIGVYQSLVTTFEQQLDKMATKWVVEHVFMTSAQRAQLAAQNAAHAASEAAKTASTTAGTATRTAVDTAATAKTTALETTSTAVHATAETAKTGATTAGATTRAAVENSGFFAKLLSLLGISVSTHTGAEAEKTAATTAGAATRAAAEDAANAAAAATQIATNIGLVTSYAGVAGAAGTASFAAAPWPIDMGAPAFGASMAAAAAAYESMAALDTGTNYLPHDMVAQIHEGERIIPKADNRQLMQVLAMGAGEGGRSDVHLHYGPHIHERERLDLKSLLATGGGDLLSFINRAVRDGKLKLKPA